MGKKKVNAFPCATIDIGAHSARMLIAEIHEEESSFIPLEELEMPVPLGSDVFRNARISNDSIRILSGILKNFKRKMQEYGVEKEHTRAIATSAVREAENAEVFLERIEHATGLVLEIFDGSEEAYLDYLAVTEIPEEYGFHTRKVLLADIGTGATQISAYEKDRLLFTETLKTGTMRSPELMHSPGSRNQVRNLLSESLEKSFSDLTHLSHDLKAETIIVLGSSARALFSSGAKTAEEKSILRITRKEFSSLYRKLLKKKEGEMLEISPSAAELPEILLPCCMILEKLFHMTNARELLLPAASTKYLLMKDFIARLHEKRNPFEKQILPMLERTAEKYRCFDPVTRNTAEITEKLFRSLEKLHGLGEKELLLLQAGALLHKSGLFINNQGYHKHSFYLILNTEIPGFSQEERRMAALIARYHRKSFPSLHHEAYALLSREKRGVVCKLSALLRLGCALGTAGVEKELLQIRFRGNEKVTLSWQESFQTLATAIPEEDQAFFRQIFACELATG